MSGPNEFYTNFCYKDVTYNLHLVKGEKFDHSVQINGNMFAVLGSKEKLETACKILNSVLLDAITSSQDLEGRLSFLNGISFPSSAKIEIVCKKTLVISNIGDIPSMINILAEELAPFVPKEGGAIVAISKEGKEPEFINLGSTTVDGGLPPDKDTAALIGSGAKMFTALLSKILEEKGAIVLEEGKGLTQSKLSDFMKVEHFQIFENPEAAKNITLESLLSHTSGLQYSADDRNNSRSGQSLDEILDGIVKHVKIDSSKAIKFANNPADKIYSYSNQIGLVAVCLEKAYKKVLVKELIATSQLKENQTLRKLSLNVKLSIPESAQEFTLKDLLNSSSPYMVNSLLEEFYVYDLLDQVLKQFEPEKSISSKYNEITYADILKRELLEPLGMDKTGFQRPIDSNILEACVIKDGSTPKTVKEDIRDPMMRGAGGLWSTPNDIMKLARSFSADGSFLDKNKKKLISKQGVTELAKVRGINGKTGLALDEGPIVGKGGSISTYDFKFKLDTSTGNAMVSMCNFTGAEKEFNAFISKAIQSLEDLNPKLKANDHLKDTFKIDALHLETQLAHADSNECDEFFTGKQGYVAVKHTDFGIIVNWNGIKLPARGSDKSFVVFGGGSHDGKEILFKEGIGSKKTPYLFIEKGINSVGFMKNSKEEVASPHCLDIPKDVTGIDGTYKSPHPDGPKPISVTTTTDELRFAYGKNDPVPGYIAKIIRDGKAGIIEIWVMTTAEDVPDKMYKLIKTKNDWSLGIALFENPETNLEDPLPRS
ncbi:MAG: serine hydrolase [Candidatus Protochlamydia sp.]|nr:serine hydrolase [Candidatus Protochlamydia sp.]